jgi:predicted lipid-binding transport protein (Tim44 family)
MGAVGGFPIDLVLLGMVAAFLVLRLRSILGRRTGYERPPSKPGQASPGQASPGQAAHGQARQAGTAKPPTIDAVAEPVARPLPDATSEAGQAMARMAAADPQFTPSAFLDGAERAFRMIVLAYATGDRAKLRPLLGDETFNAFDAAITAREQAGETQRTEIRSVPMARIESARLTGSVADIEVRFVSDQINMVSNKAGQPVFGTDAVTEINDLWTFERDMAQPSPAWRLVSARNA